MGLKAEEKKALAAPTVVTIDHELLQAIASVNGGITPTKAEGVELFPVSVAMRKAREAASKIYNVGDLIPDQGVYLGKYSPVDREGRSLGKVFNVFAAPQDLPDVMTYAETVKYIAGLEKWYGFNGTNYQNDKEIYAALEDGSYNGGWVIPPRELVVGTEPDGKTGIRMGKVIQPDNLFNHQNVGVFKGTFKTDASGSIHFRDCYWSSTEYREKPTEECFVQFSSGTEEFVSKNIFLMSCRPVRLVEVLGG